MSRVSLTASRAEYALLLTIRGVGVYDAIERVMRNAIEMQTYTSPYQRQPHLLCLGLATSNERSQTSRLLLGLYRRTTG